MAGIIKVVSGDIFEMDADTYVIPCSTIGSMSDSFYYGMRSIWSYSASGLQPNKLGNITTEQITIDSGNNDNKIVQLIFAVTVEGNSSNISAIRSIAKHIALLSKGQTDIRHIACPLLGTGEGGLDPVGVFLALRNEFRLNGKEGVVFTVVVQRIEYFNSLLSIINRETSVKKSSSKALATDDDDDDDDISDKSIEPIFKKSIRSNFLTDYYAETDQLNYELYASAIVSFINHRNTKPPLTIGIMAPWGKGKTSLMRFIEKKLKALKPVQSIAIKEQNKKKKSGSSSGSATFALLQQWIEEAKTQFFYQKRLAYPVVWLNAWKFQKNEQLWAGFADEIIKQLVNQLPSKLAKEEFWLRLNLKRVDQEKLLNEIRLKIVNKLFVYLVGVLFGMLVGLILFLVKSTEQLPLIFKLLLPGSITIASLIKLFIEKAKINKEKVDFDITKYIKQPDYSAKRGYFHEVEEDLRDVMNILVDEGHPAVIFIDDLDRCVPTTVAEVVEAINLFISGDFPRCYFILGQDAQMIAASLDVAYDKINDKSGIAYREQGSLGWHFMEKFIQLQFCIPVISDKAGKLFFKSFFGLKEGQINTENSDFEKQAKALENKISEASSVTDLLTEEMLDMEELLKSADPVRAVQVQEQIIKKAAEIYDDNDPEVIGLIDELSPFLGSSPRSIKRFINLYRFYRFLQFTNRNAKLQETSGIHLGQWIIFMIRWPRLVRAIQWDTESEFITGNTAIQRSEIFESMISKCSDYASWDKVVADNASQAKWLRDIELYRFWYLCKDGQNSIVNAVKIGIW